LSSRIVSQLDDIAGGFTPGKGPKVPKPPKVPSGTSGAKVSEADISAWSRLSKSVVKDLDDISNGIKPPSTLAESLAKTSTATKTRVPEKVITELDPAIKKWLDKAGKAISKTGASNTQQGVSLAAMFTGRIVATLQAAGFAQTQAATRILTEQVLSQLTFIVTDTPTREALRERAKSVTQAVVQTVEEVWLAPDIQAKATTRVSVANLPSTNVKSKTDSATALLPIEKIVTKTEAKAQPLPATRAKIGVTTKTVTQTDKRLPPIKLPLPDGTSVSLTREQYAGIVAWKQGIFYVIAYPPYGKSNIIYTRKPVKGIVYAKGPGAPQRSAAVVGGGKLPHSFEVAMGVTKLRVSPGASKSKPKLTYRASKPVRPRLGIVRL
jgi:hypothetical protein